MCSLLASPVPSAAQKRPGVHRAEGGCCLGDDRRVVALTGRVDDAERQARGLQRRAQPGPGEGRLALPLAPRREVVRAHGCGEADLLGQLGGGDEIARVDLLVRGVEAEDRHGWAVPPTINANPCGAAAATWATCAAPASGLNGGKSVPTIGTADYLLAMSTYTHGHHESVLRSHRWRTAENSAAYLLPHLSAGDALLDVGCGPGTLTADLASRVASVHALEQTESALDLARAEIERRGSTNVTFASGDVHRLDLPDDRFDVVHATRSCSTSRTRSWRCARWPGSAGPAVWSQSGRATTRRSRGSPSRPA
jgi:hypothetical protein